MNHPMQLSPQATRAISNWQPVWKWDSLNVGDFVEAWSKDQLLYQAYVHDMSEEGDIVWLIEYGTGSRRLYLRGEVTLYRPQSRQARLVELSTPAG